MRFSLFETIPFALKYPLPDILLNNIQYFVYTERFMDDDIYIGQVNLGKMIQG